MAAHGHPDRQWIKSSRSGVAACVELAAAGGGWVAVRDSKRPATELNYSPQEFDAFLWAAKRGEFDHFLRD